jgi:hypothetical protein
VGVGVGAEGTADTEGEEPVESVEASRGRQLSTHSSASSGASTLMEKEMRRWRRQRSEDEDQVSE